MAVKLVTANTSPLPRLATAVARPSSHSLAPRGPGLFLVRERVRRERQIACMARAPVWPRDPAHCPAGDAVGDGLSLVFRWMGFGHGTVSQAPGSRGDADPSCQPDQALV
jgi:hypothetical protein